MRKWIHSFVSSFRLYERQQYYMLWPLLWKIPATHIWSFDFLKFRIVWVWPYKTARYTKETGCWMEYWNIDVETELVKK